MRVPITVAIHSHFNQGGTWTGTLHVRKDQSDAQLLERVFRAFNRVTDADVGRLERWGYHLPSLSSSDVVVLDYGEPYARAYRVAGVGFEHLTDRAAKRYLAPAEQRERGDRIVDRITTVLDATEECGECAAPGEFREDFGRVLCDGCFAAECREVDYDRQEHAQREDR